MDAKDATTKVWLFSELVKNKPAKGTNDYPVAIKATHLDENWKRTTLRPPKETDESAGLYEVTYDQDGTRITRILPSGAYKGELLYYDSDYGQWSVLPAVSSDTLHVLGIRNNELQWVETQDCPA